MTPLPELDGSYALLGERRVPVDGHTLEIVSPVDGSVVGLVHEFTAEEIETAMTATAEHQPDWAEQPLDVRARIMAKAAGALAARVDAPVKGMVFNMRPWT